MASVEEVVIGSAGNRVVLSDLSATDNEGWRAFSVTLESAGLRAIQTIADYVGFDVDDDRTGTSGLAELIQSTAEEYRGWEGTKCWESIEGELFVEATSDRTGHAAFDVRMRNSAQGWEVQLTVTLDVMERERLVGQLKSFFRARAL